jgi:uncharacterized protein
MIAGMDPVTIETRLRDFLSARADEEGIAAAYLFGSVAQRGKGCGVGVLYDLNSPSEGWDLAQEIEDLFGTIEVVVLHKAGPELAVRIFSEGELLVERDRKRRVQFEVDTRNEHWDFEPYLHMIRKANGSPLRASLEDLLEGYREPRQERRLQTVPRRS